MDRVANLRLLTEFARDLRDFAGADLFRAAALVLAGALVEGIGLLLLIPLLSLVLRDSGSGGILGEFSGKLLAAVPEGSPLMQLAALLAGFGVLMILRSAVLVARDTKLAHIQIAYVQDRRLRIMQRLAESSWPAVARLRHGRITHLLGADMFTLREVAHFLIQCVVSAVMLAANLVLAFLISPLLALALLALLGFGAAALLPIVRRSRLLGSAVSDANLTLMDNATQFLGGLKLAISQNLQRSYVQEFELTLAEATERQLAFARQRAVTQVTLALFAASVAAAALLIDVAFVGSSAPELIALLVVLARMNAPASQLQQGSQQIFHALPAFAKIKGLEADLPLAAESGPPAPSQPGPSGAIRFHDVSFEHRASEQENESGGVRNLSLTIPQGSFVGLVGASGAGKTTFADLLVGLYPPQRGQIIVGEIPIAGEMVGAWRNAISYVSQDPYLFHDSIRGNLAWARPGASEEEIWRALGIAGADALVRRLPAGLETVVGERGGLLSGGERQRIALARALIRRPELLILDEATNALDVGSERDVLERLVAIVPRPTILMIAHRDQSLARCERILRLENGRLVEDAAPQRAP